jgi:peptide subunit release factor 1 (eRF1)
MISRSDMQRILNREASERQVLSVYLDLSVNSDNKRTHQIFLNQQRNRFAELESDRAGRHREELEQALARLDRWLAEEYDEANRGVAFFTEPGGDWLDVLQFPVPVENRLELSEDPVIGPLAEIVQRSRRHGLVLVDREHVRMLAVQMGVVEHEHEVRGDPYPTPHDVKAGGYSAKDYQKRKAEEARHFFKEFAKEVAAFDRRFRIDDLLLLGTVENVKAFADFLDPSLQAKIAHTAQAPVDATASELLGRIEPYFVEQLAREEAAAVDMLRERVERRHLAAAGVQDTLVQLQEGKVQTLFLDRNARRDGARCNQCRFYLARDGEACPYCGGETRDGVDLVEAMIRLAETQEVSIEFVDGRALGDMNGVGALLRF